MGSGGIRTFIRGEHIYHVRIARSAEYTLGNPVEHKTWAPETLTFAAHRPGIGTGVT